MGRIETALQFLREQFDSSDYLNQRPEAKKYRFEHSVRVANIGKKIAESEGFDVEALVVACLLHDVSYCMTFPNGKDDVINHGRYSAGLARPLVKQLGFSEELENEILFGIAIHADGKADFDGEPTHFSISVTDADNIDRHGVYRLIENLNFKEFITLSHEEQQALCAENLERLGKYEKMKFATLTATRMWVDTVRTQRTFYEDLRKQLENSERVL